MRLVSHFLLRRVIVFIVGFVLLSGVIGSSVIRDGYLFRYHFDIYGSAGKVLIVAILAFLILVRRRVKEIKESKVNNVELLGFVISIVCAGLFFVATSLLIDKQASFQSYPVGGLLAHLLLISSVGFWGIASFGSRLIAQIMWLFHRELLGCLAGALLFYFAFSYIFSLWPYLSGIVLVSVVFLLRFSFDPVTVLTPLTVQLPQFSVTIGEYCSGIESLFLFSSLYFLIGLVDRERFNFRKFFGVYPLLVFGLIIINIFRVYIIILSGVFISPTVAATLFHTYLGMVFFIIYFIVFWKLSYNWLLRSNK